MGLRESSDFLSETKSKVRPKKKFARAGGVMSLACDCTCVYLYSCRVLSNVSRVVSAVGMQVCQ